MNVNSQNIKKIAIGAMLVTIGILLPFLTGQIPEIGSMLLPMHIPVLLSGFILGRRYGLLVGFITPLLRSILFKMPPIYPQAISMAFELAAYGYISGLIFKILYKQVKPLINIYISLITAMIIGRIVYGMVMWFLVLFGNSYTFKAFISGVLLNAWPGIILQLILIPIIIKSLLNAKLIDIKYER